MSRLGFPNLHHDHGMRVEVVVSLRMTSSNFDSHRCSCNMDIRLMHTRGEARGGFAEGRLGANNKGFYPQG